jgi:hypothetical protein
MPWQWYVQHSSPHNWHVPRMWEARKVLKEESQISTAKPTRCTSFSHLFILNNTLHFRQSFRPLSGVRDGTYSNRHTSNRYGNLLASGNEMELFHGVPASQQVAVTVWHMPVAVCTVLNSWWWTESPSETCKVLFKINKCEKLVHPVGLL